MNSFALMFQDMFNSEVTQVTGIKFAENSIYFAAPQEFVEDLEISKNYRTTYNLYYLEVCLCAF